MKVYTTVSTPLGALSVACDGEFLTNLSFGEIICNATPGTSPIIEDAISQLLEYFAGKRKTFTLKLKPKGTNFQKSVWQELCKIPYGETISYKELATRIGIPKACRAVGMANNKNPLPIIIPCHRVVATNGKLTGYAGGLEIKRFLLELEKQHK